MKMHNRLKAMLKEGKTALGAFISIPAPAVVEVAALSGIDFVIVDTEHASHNVETIENMLRTAEIYGTTCIVCLTDLDHKNIGRMLDIGAHGIQVPMVNTPEQAEEAVKSAKFAPEGTRGISGGRGARWGNFDDYYVESNKETMVVCMCETCESVENIDAIASVPGVDAIFIDTSDLSQSMGVTGQIHHPDMQAAIRKVCQACVSHGVAPGVLGFSVEDAALWSGEGFRYIPIFNDMCLFVAETKAYVKDIRES